MSRLMLKRVFSCLLIFFVILSSSGKVYAYGTEDVKVLKAYNSDYYQSEKKLINFIMTNGTYQGETPYAGSEYQYEVRLSDCRLVLYYFTGFMSKITFLIGPSGCDGYFTFQLYPSFQEVEDNQVRFDDLGLTGHSAGGVASFYPNTFTKDTTLYFTGLNTYNFYYTSAYVNQLFHNCFDTVEGFLFSNVDVTWAELGFEKYENLYSRHLAVGDKFTYINTKYIVTEAATAAQKGRCLAVGTSLDSLYVHTIAIDGQQDMYDVIGIDSNAFRGSDLTSIIIDKDSSIKTIPASCFDGCKSLKKIYLRNKSLRKIGKNAFRNCKKAKLLYITSNKIGKKSIGKGAFKNVKKITITGVKKSKRATYAKYVKKAGAKKVIVQ